MKKIAVAVVASVALMGSTLAMADTQSIVAANNEIGVAAMGSLTNYQEHITPGPADTESGWTPGVLVKGSYMGNLLGFQNVYGQLKASYTSGNIAYKGALFNPNTGAVSPYDSTDDSTMYRIMGRVGKGFTLGTDAMVTPYIAAGYQHWNRHLVGQYGYTEDYSAVLAGVGVKGQYALTDSLVLGANAEYLAVVDGHMTPNLYNGMLGTANFGTSGEEVVGLNADYRLLPHVHLFGGLSYTHHNYTGGSLKYGFYEPLSSTNLFDLDAGVAYSF
jgi:hypothetical protein